jgi:pimeloyl-ACP methyl ester carboxylesterase
MLAGCANFGGHEAAPTAPITPAALTPATPAALTPAAGTAPVQAPSFAGKVYLFRGGAGGIFSAGMDRWSRQLTTIGVPNEVASHLTWQASCAHCVEEAAKVRGPVVIVGHSYGADAALRFAEKLNEANVPVELLVTMDPVMPIPVTKNVRRVINLYMPHEFWDNTPFWHGVPLQAEAASTVLENVHLPSHAELNMPGLNHGNLDDHPIIQQEGIRHILRICRR